MAQTIPIVDFKSFLDDSPQSVKIQTARELVRACKDVGFVYIRNHGLPQSDLDQAFALSKKFYDLPVEQKMKAPHPPGWAVHRGYSWPGLEKVSNAMSLTDDEDTVKKLREIQDYKESYEVGSEQNLDMPNIWPPDEVLPEWKPFMTAFYWTCFETAKRILRALALGLGLADEDTLLRPHSGHYNQLRLLHYPPIPVEWLSSNKFARMPAHSDWSTITFLFQDGSGGLQVESPVDAGTFLEATPVEGTLVLNVGDLLMRWSNGKSTARFPASVDLGPGSTDKVLLIDYLKSTQHRVRLPSVENRLIGDDKLTHARYSIPYFVSPDPGVVIECLDLDKQSSPKYEPITQRDYAAMRARMQY